MVDEDAKKILDNVVKEDDILNQNIASKDPENPGESPGRSTGYGWLRRNPQTLSALRIGGS